ncbi:MAG: isocitrate/isopropylmalate family dehydrogenase, partial [Rhodothermales bacterium]|nr:isocitrate/isopropylmalate family dehydrogenase [Rhodothermales bacterium]
MPHQPTPARPSTNGIHRESAPAQRASPAISAAYDAPARCLIGVLPGEGIGPEVTGAALRVLEAVSEVTGLDAEVRFGGAIGRDAEREHGRALSDGVVAFMEGVFADGGAVFAGAAGGRFVYDTRKHFDLFCKVSPIVPSPALRDASRIKAAFLRGVDLLVVRENIGGLYQGEWAENGRAGQRTARHAYTYDEGDVRRVITVAVRLAKQRRGVLHTVGKTDGAPTINALWRDVGAEVAAAEGVELVELDADLAVYHLLQHAQQ